MDMNITLKAWNNHFVKSFIPNIIFNMFCLTIGFVGNMSVLLVYTLKMKNNNEDRYFIPVLASLDLTATCLSTVLHVTDYFYFVSYPVESLCVVLNFLSCFTSTASAHMLFVIGVQRYFKICRPHGFQMTLFWKRIAIVILLFLCLSYSIPIVIASGVRKFDWSYKGNNVTGYACSVSGNENYSGFNSRLFYSVLLILLFVNIIATFAVYAPIGKVIYKRYENTKSLYNSAGVDDNNKTVNEDGNKHVMTAEGSYKGEHQKYVENHQDLKRVRRSTVNFNIMFLTMVFFYLVSFLPTLTMFVITSKDTFYWFKQADVELNVYIWLNRLFIVHHVVNPFVYTCFDFKFRDSLKLLIKWKTL
ncbi:unnamed protein product [Mytilus coruscus]|uniref:G-protein coupled receptors family 1 profile domain-containing protein n=1 Tax=Mytilus coruscus TaxID=42192 RepID=A0A6J8C398_MYTCO|nr:unnamed protein product [Mytilus coruscus]